MMDKSLHIFLIVMFGVGALMILLMSWLRPMPVTERIIMTFFAAIGVVWAWMIH